MTNQPDSNMIIDAAPTKDFFIYMLTKDIPLIRTIVDLVDNCVDGALRLRSNSDYNGLWIRIEIAADSFRIADNCGGILVDVARHYAFRFGRPEDMEPTPGSVGQFGVGMKRAFFKLGGRFRVESTTETSRFVVDETVDEWKRKEEWQFKFDEFEEDLTGISSDQWGTIITVTSLHKNVSNSFKLENFQTRLIQEIAAAHQSRIGQGLSISLSGIPLKFRPLTLLHSDQLKPAYREMVFNEQAPAPVTVKIFSGLSESNPSHAGWYIFCNGRMLFEHDQTVTTGWGETTGRTIPKYHNQFARFRGYVFFDSDDAGLLPWNTTKTGVDIDSPIFQAVRLEMIRLMRPVIDFINKLDAEKDRDEADDTPLEAAVRVAKIATLTEIDTRARFHAPKPAPTPSTPRTGNIQYRKPLDEIKLVKRVLKARSNKEAGEKTFEYFLEMECQD